MEVNVIVYSLKKTKFHTGHWSLVTGHWSADFILSLSTVVWNAPDNLKHCYLTGTTNRCVYLK